MYLIAKFYNNAFNNKKSIFIYLTLLSVIFNLIICVITHKFRFDYLLFLILIALVLSLTTIRLSSVIIYSPLLKVLSMNLVELHMYAKYDYDKDKVSISNEFKESFIEGLVFAGKKGYKKIYMTTHRWVLENVLSDERVRKYYNVEYKESGIADITLEALLLTNGNTSLKNFKRHQYKIIMSLKK